MPGRSSEIDMLSGLFAEDAPVEVLTTLCAHEILEGCKLWL